MNNAIAQNTHNLKKKLNKNLSGDLPRNLLLSVIKIILEKSVVVKTYFRSRDKDRWVFRSLDRDLDKMNSSLETMESRSQHWLHHWWQSTRLNVATNYGNRATGVGTKHAVLRPRPILGLETETWTK